MRVVLHFLTAFFFSACCFMFISANTEKEHLESPPSNETFETPFLNTKIASSGVIFLPNAESGLTSKSLTGCTGVVINASATSTDATCTASDGTATASVSTSGATGTIIYAWNNGDFGASISGLAAATYSVTASDANGCMGTTSVTVGTNDIALVVSATATDASCNGNDGTATASVSGGTGTISYAWDNGGSGATISGLAAGNYTVIATDANGCTGTATVTVGSNGIDLFVSATAQDATCAANDGSATAFAISSASGGTGTISYAWDNGDSGESIFGLAPGDYTVTATDVNGCTGTTTVTVGSNNVTLTVAVSATDATCNAADGTATAGASGGTTPYTYAWDNGDSGASISGLAAGNYTVIATDANGCTGTTTVSVGTNNVTLAVSATATDATCNGNDGTATASVSGGTGAISYAWDNGDSGASISGLAAGNYTVIATDANGCTGTTTVTVGQETNCDPYCPSAGQSTNYEWIESVDVAGTSNTSGDDGGYGDYTSIIIPLTSGSNSIHLTPGFSGSSYYEYWSVWIDYNQDGDFDDWGELVFYGASFNPINGSFYVPNNAMTGQTRMRIAMKFGGWPYPCQNFAEGEVEDYTVDISICNNIVNGGSIGEDEVLCGGANDPAEMYSINNGSGGSGTIEYLWLMSTTTNVPPNGNNMNGWVAIPNSNSPSYDPGSIAQTTWYIRCARRSGCTEYTGESNVIEKTLEANCEPDYCESAGESTQYEWIKKVKIQYGFNNNSGDDGGYGDYTNLSVDLYPGEYPWLQLRPGFSGSSYQEYWRVWVDWNQDGDFDDWGEKEVQQNGYGTIWTSISVPYNISNGSYRMRVSMKYGGYAHPCEVFAEGEVEDYTINIIGAQHSVVNPTNDDSPVENAYGNAQKSVEVSLYPNPATEQVFVKMAEFEGKRGTLRITNNLGQVIEMQEMDNISPSPYEISLDRYIDGVYYMILQVEGEQTITKKFMVGQRRP